MERNRLVDRTCPTQLERGVRVKRKEHDEDVAAFAGIKQEYDTSITEIAKAEELLQTLLTGLSANSNGEGEAAGGYMGQLAEAKARVAAAGTEAEQAKVTIGITEKELKEKEPRAKKASKDGEGGLQKLESEKKKLEQVNAKLAKLDWDEEKEQGLSQRRADLEEKIATLSEKRDTLRSRLAAIDFSYSDPYPNFDRSQVKGLVANLIDLDPAMYKNATALEICAGGKLYNVVVEDEQVGSALLDKGKLRKRVTIIPLNKISAFKMSAEVSPPHFLQLYSGDEWILSVPCRRNLLRQRALLLARSTLPCRSLGTMRTFRPLWLTSSATCSSVKTKRPLRRSRSTRLLA
jgi:structural maintenance of chromosome 2